MCTYLYRECRSTDLSRCILWCMGKDARQMSTRGDLELDERIRDLGQARTGRWYECMRQTGIDYRRTSQVPKLRSCLITDAISASFAITHGSVRMVEIVKSFTSSRIRSGLPGSCAIDRIVDFKGAMRQKRTARERERKARFLFCLPSSRAFDRHHRQRRGRGHDDVGSAEATRKRNSRRRHKRKADRVL